MSNNTDCACKSGQKPEHLAVAVRGLEHRIGARLSESEARQIVRYCSTHACSQSEAFRRAIATLAATAGDPNDKKLAALIDVLGLPPSASSQDVLAAVQALLGDGANKGAPPPAADAGATSANADTAPAAALSKAEQAYCAKHKITPAEFQARKRSAARTVPKKKG